MKSTPVCTECLRAMRRSIRASGAPNSLWHGTPASAIRAYIVQPPRWQQQQATSQPSAVPLQPPPPTKNTFPSPQLPSNEPPPSSTNEPSTAQMQATIRSNLSHSSGMFKLARAIRSTSLGRATTETYVVYGYAESLFRSCSAQAPYTIPEELRTQVYSGRGPPKTAQGEDIGVPDEAGSKNRGSVFWHEQLAMLPTFSTWSQVAYLHFYILLTHLRTMEDYNALQMHQRYLIEHFSQNAEDKMTLLHSMDARGIRNRYLKDLFIQWRGCIAAYDEGMVKGDAVLGAAIWRNLFKGEQQVDWEKVAVVVAYMRKCINLLGQYSDLYEMRDALDGPNGVWSRAKQGLLEVVDEPSRGIQEPL